MDPAPVRLDYEALVDEYQGKLQTQLRGFRTAHDFLDMWVHDEDPVRSLLNIVEAAEAGGVAAIEIAIGPDTLARLDEPRLVALVGRIGRTRFSREGDGARLRVAL